MAPEPPQPETHSVFREYLEALIVAAIFLGFTNTFVLKTFYIPSGSMEDTLLVGDHLFVNRYIFGAQPTAIEKALLPGREVRRGDIVIFRSPETPKLDLVKRCIGLPGDEILAVDKELYVNGELFPDEGFSLYRDRNVYSASRGFSANHQKRDNFGPLTVPEDHLFCMGDNRDFSYDSRYFGPVPYAHVKGRAFLIYWSYGGETSDGTWKGMGHRLQQFARTTLGFLTKTRWSRTFHLIR